jgi:hypothetical protein
MIASVPVEPGRQLSQALGRGSVFMTKLLQSAIETVRQLAPESQDEIARAMLRLAAAESAPETVDPAHLSAILDGLAQAKRRDFASSGEVEAAFRRFDA